ncbi:MAG TPA: DUF58 domain-containing protein [Anaerolineae bacterium]|nr:DUF58 domain-containing protein [Anaerolineae bacterium]
MIFDESTLRKLTRLALVASRVRAGALKGERRSTKRGTSVEFADYRNYVHGDDLRRMDWNVYARLDRPFIKLREEEEDLAVHVLVDASQSMRWGDGEHDKFAYALRLAAALGAIALADGDRLTIAVFKTSQARRETSEVSLRGQQHLLRLLKFLEAQTPAGATDLNLSLRDYAVAARRPGLAVLISDLFSPDGYQAGLTQLQSRGYEAILIHLLAPDELDPPLSGDLRLVDTETGHAQEVSLDGGLRELYRRRVRAWREEIQAYCRKRTIRFLPVTTNRAWDEVVLLEMRRAGVVK